MNSIARSLWLTARPKTLAASVVPVLVAHALATTTAHPNKSWVALFAVFSAIMIQVGTNYVNDALDFIKGADKDTRLGEARASQQGWFTAKKVMAMGFFCFAVATALGIPLVIEGGWPIFLIGVISIFMGYCYTGGPFPLAYVGLGDLFVVIFFGVVAVGGVFYLETKDYTLAALVAGLQIGLLATVLIAINNLRDLEQDRDVGKRTLAVRLGPKRGRLEVLFLIASAFLLNGFWLSKGFLFAFAMPLFALPVGLRLVRTLLRTEASREYNQLLARAAFMHMLFGILLSLGFILK